MKSIISFVVFTFITFNIFAQVQYDPEMYGSANAKRLTTLDSLWTNDIIEFREWYTVRENIFSEFDQSLGIDYLAIAKQLSKSIIQLGMTTTEVLQAIGSPSSRDDSTWEWGTTSTWFYNDENGSLDRMIKFENGKVKSIHNY